MTDAEKFRLVAEWLEPMPVRPEDYGRLANNVAFSRLGMWCHEFGKREWVPVHDFLHDATANELILEAMPEPQLWLESEISRPKLWGCDPRMSALALPAFHADRKTAVVDAFILFIEAEKKA